MDLPVLANVNINKLCDQAIVVQVILQQNEDIDALQEFESLGRAANIVLLHSMVVHRHVINPSYCIGSGKAKEIATLVQQLHATLVLFNYRLSATQTRNLERCCGCRVVDRTELILNIFAQRAQSYEGKLQVELAQLRHLSTRLVRHWSHLERQKGGIGLRGPGETQLETDRRLIKKRISQLLQRLHKCEARRRHGERIRNRTNTSVVTLVGYTNAGKSTLFNWLTHAGSLVSNQLFSTLDPTLRRIDVGKSVPVVLADTVGFVRQLPHELVAAFKTTLQETRYATLLLHIVDATDPAHEQKIAAVNQVLIEIGAEHTPTLLIFNKIDQLDNRPSEVRRDSMGVAQNVWVSAHTGAGMGLLLEVLRERLAVNSIEYQLRLPVTAYGLRCHLYGLGIIIQESVEHDGTMLLLIRTSTNQWRHLIKQQTQLINFII